MAPDKRDPYSSRQARLRILLRRRGISALFVTYLPNVRYLTGFSGTSGAALITGSAAIFFTDSRYRIQAEKEVKGCRLMEQKGPLVLTAARIAGRRRIKKIGFESSHLTVKMYGQLKKSLPGVSCVPTEGLVEKLRTVKDRHEVSLLRRAAAIAGTSYAVAARRLLGRVERDVASALEAEFRKQGAETAAFPSIIASGKRGALPHASPGNGKVKSGELVVIDFGARYKGYHSDITRTRVTGRAAPRARSIYRIVEEAQRTAIESVRPGVMASEVDRAARQVIAAAGYGRAFGHGTGHGVGLEVHEAPSIAPGSGDILLPGMVFTVEPGIYVENFGGVRIEDMVLVTESGCEILSRSVPKTAL